VAPEGAPSRAQPADVAATPRVDSPAAGTRSGGGRPVLLATLEVPFDAAACELAVDAAVEAGQPLLVVVLAELLPLPLSTMLGYDQVVSPEDEAAFVAPAALAASLGVAVERLRVRSPRPVDALLELASERRPGLLVFGPDRELVPRRRYRKAARALSERAPCLVWIAS
jgi:Universal stress protein family